jgi:hypothetical protein
MAIRCMAGRQTRIERCILKDEQLESAGSCTSDKHPSSILCSQNLKGKTTLNVFV